MPFNFWKRKTPPGPAPARPSADPELDQLQAEVVKRQEQVAAVELELLEFNQFNQEIETRLGPWQRRVADLETAVADARARATRRAMWGERAEAGTAPEDVVEQYKRAWTQSAEPPPPAPPPAPAPADELHEAKIKTLYRQLAKRFHPDLASTPEAKAARAGRMAEINAAYAARDWAKLQAIADEPDQPRPPAVEAPRPKTRAEMVQELQREIARLDGVLAQLDHMLTHELSQSLVDFKLEADLARRAGRDLLAELELDLRAEVARLEGELAAFTG